jgi:uncharacterized protein
MPEWEEGRVKKMKVLLSSRLDSQNFDNIKKIAVLSDTHLPVRAAKIPTQIIQEIKTSDLIVHAGDFQTIEVLEYLKKLGKFVGVCGNSDSDDVADSLPSKAIINITNDEREFKIAVIHGGGPPEGLAQRILHFYEDKPDCIIFGHSHKPLNEKMESILMFNPGSPTDTVFATINTYGILRLDNNGIKGEIIKINGI